MLALAPNRFLRLQPFLHLPSVSQLPSLNLPSLVLFEPHVLPSPVKPGKSRQIAANETGNHARRIRQDELTSGISQVMGYDFCRPERGRAHCASIAWLAGLFGSRMPESDGWRRIRRTSRTRTVALRSCGRTANAPFAA